MRILSDRKTRNISNSLELDFLNFFYNLKLNPLKFTSMLVLSDIGAAFNIAVRLTMTVDSD